MSWNIYYFWHISHPHVVHASLLISEIKTADEKEKGFHPDRLDRDRMMKGPQRGEHWVSCVPADNASFLVKDHGLMSLAP